MALFMAGLGNRGQGLIGREKSSVRSYKQYVAGDCRDDTA